MLQKANRRSTLLWAAAAVLACLAVEYVSFGLSQMDWSVPLLYGGDGVSGVNGVKEALRGGGLLGWPFYEPPAGTDPNYSMLYTIYLTLAGLFTDNFALVFNLYILLIPVLNTAVSFFALRALQVRGWLAFAGALTFGLCPYVQQRLNGHMGLAAVECIPLVFLLCLWCAEDDRFNRPGKGFFQYRRNWLSLLFAWAIANNGMVYYPFFGCFLLCVVALCLLLRDKHPRVLPRRWSPWRKSPDGWRWASSPWCSASLLVRAARPRRGQSAAVQVQTSMACASAACCCRPTDTASEKSKAGSNNIGMR